MFKRIICGLICFGLFLGNTPVFAQATAGRMTLRQAIMQYAQAGDVQSLQQIRARGFDIDTPDENANSALCEAVWRGDSDAAATLIKAGANQNSSCMKRIPKEYKQSAGADAEKQKMMQLDLDTVSQNGSPAVVGVASKEATLTTGAMIGIGVGAAALIGGGIALASNHDNKKSTPKSTVVCPPGYTGEDCKTCVEGYGKHGASGDDSCYKTLICYHEGKQVGDVCECAEGYYVGDNCQTCDIGYGWHGTTSCWADITCANGVQIANACECNIGYIKDEDGACTKCAKGYGKYGEAGDEKCYPTIECGEHGTQVRNSCSCEGNWTGAKCATCRLVNDSGRDGEKCECKENFVEYGDRCIPNPDCTGSKTQILNCAEGQQRSCMHGDDKLYTCEACIGNFDLSTNCTTCLPGYKIEDGECVEVCHGAVKNITDVPGCTHLEACPEDPEYFYCTACKSGFDLNSDRRCVIEVGTTGLKDGQVMNEVIAEEVPIGNTDFYGLSSTRNVLGAAYATGKGDYSTSAVSKFSISREEAGVNELAGVYTSKDAYGSCVLGADLTALNDITIKDKADVVIENEEKVYGKTYGIYAGGNVYGARVEKSNATITGDESAFEYGATSANVIRITNVGDGLVYGLYGASSATGSRARVGIARNGISITNTGDGNVWGIYSDKEITGTLTSKQVLDGDGNILYPSADGARAENVIVINNVGDGTVYGFGLKKDGTGTGTIYGAYMNRKITKTNNSVDIAVSGSGDVYGFCSEGDIYGARSSAISEDSSVMVDSGAQNQIYISNNGSGNIYGMKTSADTFGAHTGGSRDAKASNLIDITNAYTINDSLKREIVGMSGGSASKGRISGACMHGGRMTNTRNITNYERTGGNEATIYGIGYATSVIGAHSYKADTETSIIGSSVNNININNLDDGIVYGISANKITGADSDYKSAKADNIISIYNYNVGSVYGMRGNTIKTSTHDTSKYEEEVNKINIFGIGSGSVYGIYAPLAGSTSGSITTQNSDSINIVSVSAIENSETEENNTKTIGIYADKGVSVTNNGSINISHQDYEEKRAVKPTGTQKKYIATEETGMITGIYACEGTSVTNSGAINTSYAVGTSGTFMGIYAGKNTPVTNNGNITTVYNTGASTEKAYGIYVVGENSQGKTIKNTGDISISNFTNEGYGIYVNDGTNVTVNNSGNITFDGSEYDGDRVNTQIIGLYVGKDTTLTNSGDINISYKESTETGLAIGIYVVGNNSKKKTITNSGNITINGFGENGYGIYVADGKNVTVTNTGTITIDGSSYGSGGGAISSGNFIVLNGGTLVQSGTLSVSSLNATTSNLTLTSGSQTIVANNFYGTATVDADTVMNGFNNTYTQTGMISAGNVDSLNLVSGSHLFKASLADNGTDVLMMRKSFDEVTDNSSLAAFLEVNYALGNNEAFFNDIKSIGKAAAFKSAMDDLTGQSTISKFAHEDLTAMREVNLQMNEKMFANNDKPMYQTQGSLSGFSFKNDNNSSANYALGTKRIAPRWKVGYAMSRTNVNTDDDHDTTRHSEVFQAFAPIGYENSGIKLISTPQVGFARGHYTRKGYNGTSYSGIIEKRIFALMNEARYPTQVAGFEIAPTVEFNAIAYNQRGSEDNKEYALTMPSDNQLSVEAGMGLYANKQIGNVKFNAGLMMYHEFADPYNVKMGMNGMEGTFNLYDDNREYRGVASFGFNYDLNDWNVYGKVQHFIENDTHTNVKAGLKYTF